MSDVAQTAIGAMDTLRGALQDYSVAATETSERTHRRLSEVGGQIAGALAERRVRLQEARDALDRCRGRKDADCSGPAQALAAAEQRLERAQQAMRLADQATARLQPALARFGRETGDAHREGLAMLASARDDAVTYLSGTGGGAGGGTGSGGLTTGAATPTVAAPPSARAIPGTALHQVAMAAINTSDRDISEADFGKGYSPADLTWAFDALEAVVLPALARGHGADYFAQRDADEGGRQGVRSYSDTYSGFFGGDAIRLERRDGAYQVANGYHRIFVARQMGLTHVPARVDG